MNFTLHRYLPKAPGWPVLGVLSWPSGVGEGLNTLATMEDPYIFRLGSGIVWPYTYVKLPGVTAIPEGVYRLISGWSTRFQKFVPRVIDVPGFEGILVHAGNYQENTQGCILVGMQRSDDRSLVASAAALELLESELRRIQEPSYLVLLNPKE